MKANFREMRPPCSRLGFIMRQGKKKVELRLVNYAQSGKNAVENLHVKRRFGVHKLVQRRPVVAAAAASFTSAYRYWQRADEVTITTLHNVNLDWSYWRVLLKKTLINKTWHASSHKTCPLISNYPVLSGVRVTTENKLELTAEIKSPYG